MANTPKSDPTKDEKFQKVVKHFLDTKPNLHKPKGKRGEGKPTPRPRHKK